MKKESAISAQVLSSKFWDSDPVAYAKSYSTATPFPHIVLDGMIKSDAINRAMRDFPEVDGPHWTNYLHVNQHKFGNIHYNTWPSSLQLLADGLMSKDFIAYLELLTGIKGLLPDPLFDGGGLHRSERGGYLNVHADYSKHHTHADWRRRVNVILYLNDKWDDAWGGHLELWSTDMKHSVKSIAPRANRMLIFDTTSTAYHGHPEALNCPPEVARKTLALYYFTAGDSSKPKSTHYRARPGDGTKRVAIYLDVKALRLYDILKRRFRISDKTASQILARVKRRRN